MQCRDDPMKRPTAVIDAVWAQRAHEAFRGAIDASTAQTKTMAAWLQERGFWSKDMSLDSAVSKFRHCVNGTHGEKFRTLELIALCVEFHLNDLLEFWAQSAGFRLVPVPDAEFDAQLVAGIDARLGAIESGVADVRGIAALIAARNRYDEQQAARAGGADMSRAAFSKEGPL